MPLLPSEREGPLRIPASLSSAGLRGHAAAAVDSERCRPDPKVSAAILQIVDELSVASDRKRVCLQKSQDEDLNSFSILEDVPLQRKAMLVQAAAADPSGRFNRAMGSMVGMAVGDALGHPFEFQPAQDTATRIRFDLPTMTFYGESNSFRLQRGQWTDDASMGLCMADSLILRQGFDGSDMRVRFWCWWYRGYNNAFRKDKGRSSSVGLGGNIAKSLQEVSCYIGKPVPPAFTATSEDAGNGSLMRFTPIALFHHSSSMDEVYDAARRSSYTTHPGIIAAEACTLLAHLIVRAMQLPGTGGVGNVQRFLEDTTKEYLEMSGLKDKSGWGYDQMKQVVNSSPENATERVWNWKHESLDIASTLRARGRRYNGYPVSDGYFGSYSLDGLAMALWSVYHTNSFDEAVTRSINLLGDADSHGSITGQLAGAIYGYNAINPQFIKWLTPWDDHEFAVRALLLYQLGSQRPA